MKMTIDNPELQGAYCRFMKNAGLIAWDLSAEPVVSDPARGQLLEALAYVEEDSKYMQKKLRHIGVLRHKTIKEFNIQWLCEEQEHATALRALATVRGAAPRDVRHDLLARDKRSRYAVMALRISSMHQRAIAAAYMCLGTINEYIALSAYVELARTSYSDNERSILRNLARQEGRHMAFYKAGAEDLMRSLGPISRWIVRTSLTCLWRPPGIDLLGYDRWIAAFSPVLNDSQARERLQGADTTMASIAGLSQVRLMSRFLARHPMREAIAGREAEVGAS